MSSLLEVLKIVGSVAGLMTAGFVVIDRFMRHRPLVYFRAPREDTDVLGLVVQNTASEAIVIDAVECQPTTMTVSFRDDWRDILDPDAKGGFAIIEANSQKVFHWLDRAKWEMQKSEDRARIVVRWSFTSSRWLPPVPVVLRTTVGRLNQLRSDRQWPP